MFWKERKPLSVGDGRGRHGRTGRRDGWPPAAACAVVRGIQPDPDQLRPNMDGCRGQPAALPPSTAGTLQSVGGRLWLVVGAPRSIRISRRTRLIQSRAEVGRDRLLLSSALEA